MKISPCIALVCLCAGLYAQAPVPIAFRINQFAGANPIAERVNARDEYIGQPVAVAADSKGNVFYCDISRAVIRKVSPEGIITTVAGNGRSGYSGDEGPATAAQINGDAAIALDAVGNLYIADTYNLRIRKVTLDGVIKTIAGNGIAGSTGDGGPATAARISLVEGLAVDGQGTVYAAAADNRIRRITPDGVIQTVAGTGVAGFSGDGGPATEARISSLTSVAADNEGSFYILDSRNYRIRKVTPDGIVKTVAGTGVPGSDGDDGPATAAKIGAVADAKPDGKGGLYFPELNTNKVRHIRPDGVMETVAGTGAAAYSGDGGPATQATLYFPWYLAFGPDGTMYISEAYNNVIRRITPDGIISTFAGRERYAGDGDYATKAILSEPAGIALDTQGNVFVSEGTAHRIRKIDSVGVITTYASGLDSPGMMTADQSGNIYFIDSNILWRGAPDGTLTKVAGGGQGAAAAQLTDGPALKAALSFPQGLTVDLAGNIYIADTGNNIIRKVTKDGLIQTVAGTGAFGFAGDGGQATAARFISPEGLAFDAAGNLYVADHFNFRVRRISPDGIITTVAGNGRQSVLDNGSPNAQGDGGPATLAQLFGPERITVDTSGSILIGEHGNGNYIGNRIRRVTPDGIIDTVAGTGDYGYVGDGGLARNAQLHYVSQIAADDSGRIFVVDRYNFRVRVLTPLYGSIVPQSRPAPSEARD